MYNGQPVYVQEADADDQWAHVMYFDSGRWWLYPKQYKQWSAVSTEVGSDGPEFLDKVQWYVGPQAQEVNEGLITMVPGHQWLMQQYGWLRAERDTVQEQLEAMEAKVHEELLHGHDQWPGQSSGVPRWPAGSSSSVLPPARSREERFPDQNQGVKMGWLNRMVALIGAIKNGDKLRAGRLMELLLVCCLSNLPIWH